MRRREFRFGTVARLLGAVILIFSMWGVGMVVTFHWLGLDEAAESTRRLSEAKLRPDRAHFRPIEGAAPPLAGANLTYVPVYSTLYRGDREAPAGLAVTLSLRNTSPDQDLVVHRVSASTTRAAN